MLTTVYEISFFVTWFQSIRSHVKHDQPSTCVLSAIAQSYQQPLSVIAQGHYPLLIITPHMQLLFQSIVSPCTWWSREMVACSTGSSHLSPRRQCPVGLLCMDDSTIPGNATASVSSRRQLPLCVYICNDHRWNWCHLMLYLPVCPLVT